VKACERVGFESTLVKMPSTTTEIELLKKIKELNENDEIDGFIVRCHSETLSKKVLSILVKMQVDGFHPRTLENGIRHDSLYSRDHRN
jgi:methylenetetrahydrofolate dehydrogenase (NADP+)/methenyltetrahydrofolate cyclohydrolase